MHHDFFSDEMKHTRAKPENVKGFEELLHSRLDVSTVSGGTDDVSQAEKVWNMQLQLDMEGTLTTH